MGEENKLNIVYFSFSKFGIWVLHEQRDVHRLDKYYVTLFSGRLGSSNQERKGMKIFAPLAATSSREAESEKVRLLAQLCLDLVLSRKSEISANYSHLIRHTFFLIARFENLSPIVKQRSSCART